MLLLVHTTCIICIPGIYMMRICKKTFHLFFRPLDRVCHSAEDRATRKTVERTAFYHTTVVSVVRHFFCVYS